MVQTGLQGVPENINLSDIFTPLICDNFNELYRHSLKVSISSTHLFELKDILITSENSEVLKSSSKSLVLCDNYIIKWICSFKRVIQLRMVLNCSNSITMLITKREGGGGNH